jgi:hypothetical protein
MRRYVEEFWCLVGIDTSELRYEMRAFSKSFECVLTGLLSHGDGWPIEMLRGLRENASVKRALGIVRERLDLERNDAHSLSQESSSRRGGIGNRKKDPNS